jgi:LmbE family N-acetylglucosaminyl deacetylase
VVDAALLLRQIDGSKRVLMIGAHPDDENSALLATLARGMGAETAYLSLTRGDGGQNLIGPELSEGLGLVRTGELVAARSIDGARQFFTRAIDYGFSKSAEEAFRHWSRAELLRDVVWVIRVFRPQVIVSVFSGTPADGHGQHQAAGIVAQEAFRAAGDPGLFPEQLAQVEPWQPTKLFRNQRGDPQGTPLTVVETGAFDPVLGRSWYQIAMEGRSQHRSQDMGAAEAPGPRMTSLVLVDAVRETAPGAGLFAGVDTSLAAIAAALPAGNRAGALAEIEQYRAAIREAEGLLGVSDPGRAVAPLARALAHLEVLARFAVGSRAEGPAVPRGRGENEVARVIAHHTAVAQRALLAAAGVVVEARAADDLLVPGEETMVTVTVWNGGRFRIATARPQIVAPAGWPVSVLPAAPGSGNQPALADPTGARVEPGELATWRFRVRVPVDARATDPYFMRERREGDFFTWPDDPAVRALPFDPPPIQAGAALELPVEGRDEPLRMGTLDEAPYVGVSQSLGEFREPVLVVPAVSVEVDQGSMAWALGDAAPRQIAVRLRGYAEAGARGAVRLETPPGWRVEPASAPFEIATAGALTSVLFRLTPPPPSGGTERVLVRAVAQADDGRRWDRAVEVIDYPHIRRVAQLAPAEVAITRIDVFVPRVRVGYIMGTGDDGYAALRQLGVDAELLTPQRVSAGDFAGFDAIVVGVRAYEVRPDLVAANARLLDFARAGGTVIVQYQQYQYPRGNFAPFPVQISQPHDRVTDELAPVRMLEPESPVLARPNRIGLTDWEGWVQERGLYFLGSWDERFVPVLEMNDPGEAPLRGSLVVAPLGEGVYVYTALAFFRQFPTGVPGAYRLLMNLIALEGADWTRYLATNPGR